MIETDFEKRYQREPVIYEDKDIKENMKKTSDIVLEQIKKNPTRPKVMSYYDEIIATDKREKELKDGKIIGTFCNFMPEELIYAVDAIPIRLCSGFYEPITIAEEVLPRDICPLVKSSFGLKMLKMDYFELCSLIVIPASCDAKKKLGEYLSDYLPVWMLDLPNLKEYKTVKEMWLKEIKKLVNRLEKFTGKRITRKKLRYYIQLLQRRTELFRNIYELRKKQPEVISHRDLSLVIQTSFYDDIHRWIEKTEELYSELKLQYNRKSESQKESILLTGAPMIFPNFKILNIIEELGANVVADDLCSGVQRLWNYAEPDEWRMESILESLVSKYVLSSTCPCFHISYDRIDRILNMILEFKIDGVIYHNLRLCQLFDMERDLVVKTLKNKNIPVLVIHTEYSPEDTAQIKTRIEAFLEIIRSKRL